MSIILDTTKLKVNEYLMQLAEYAGFDRAWADELWLTFMEDDGLYQEFIYYLENHTFLDQYQVSGYSLSDLYVWQMDKYNLIRDLGKNPENCNKETLVMYAFQAMVRMRKNPEEYVKRLESGRGNDVL